MTKTMIRGMSTLLLAMALPLAAQAAEPNAAATKQISTAAAHAGMALGATDLATAHAHLDHVINCIVGENGKGFDAKAADPCKGMGNGALADSKGDAAVRAKVLAALKTAEQGTKTTTLDAAHADAKKVMESLQSK